MVSLSIGVINKLIASMSRRVQAVIKAKGWYTKYELNYLPFVCYTTIRYVKYVICDS